MTSNRPAIPAATKREVRQRCGFGCVICGCPIIEYDHIEEWATVREHTPENLTLLCDTHHRQKGTTLSKETIIHHNRTPYNLSSGTKVHFKLEPNIFQKQEVSLGNTRGFFTSPQKLDGYKPIIFENYTPITAHVEDNFVLISALFYDAKGMKLFEIERNEIKTQVGVWDFEWTGDTLTIRVGPKEIAIRISYSAKGFIVERATFHSQHSEDDRFLTINPDGSLIQMPNNNRFNNMMVEDVQNAIFIS